MNVFLEHQIASIVGSFIAGSIIAALIYRYAQSSLSWKIADLVWVALGGVGAIAALLSGSYNDERGRVDRQIDISYAITKSFETSAARFHLQHCVTDRQGRLLRPATQTLCGKVDLLTTSAHDNSNLPLFLDVAQTRTPLSTLGWVLGGKTQAAASAGMTVNSMMDMVDGFDVAGLHTIAAMDDPRRDRHAGCLPPRRYPGGIPCDCRQL